MRKRVNNIDCSVLRCGVGAGEHGAAIEQLSRVLSEMKDGYLDAFSLRLRAVEYPEELFYEVARIAKERKLYFSFLYAYQFAPPGKRSHLNAEIVQKVRKIAG